MTEWTDLDLAQGILNDLQSAATAHDLPAMLDLLTEDIVLLGSAAASLDRDAATAYVEQVLAYEYPLLWEFETVRVIDSRPEAVTFVALGSVGFDGPDEPRDPFRLTCLAVDEGDRWRLRHFHGSVPQA